MGFYLNKTACIIMTSLLKSSMVLRPIMTRKMSDVVKASSGSKFVVTDGKFTKVSQDVTQVHEEITHTGQIFAENDPRRARFIGRKKMVNKNWAVRMAAEEPVIEVDGRKATSDFTDQRRARCIGPPQNLY